MEEDELWKPIRGYEERYAISDHGRVKSLRKDNILIGDKNNYGYRRVRLFGGRYFVHRLVAEHFVRNPRPRDYHYVNHLDGDKTNNHASNLKWVTASQNIQHAYKNGLNIPMKRLTFKHVIKIRTRAKYTSQEQLAREHGVSIRTIFNIINFNTYLQ